MIQFDTTRVLSTAVAFRGTGGVTPYQLQASTSDLRNSYEDPMYVDEIRFYVVPFSQNTFFFNVDLFNYIQVECRTQRHIMMGAPVYINMLTPDVQMNAEQSGTGGPGSARELITTPSCYRSWKPPKPIVLPPGESFILKLSYQPTPTYNTVITDKFTVYVALVGRITRDKLPRATHVPYIIQYEATSSLPDAPLISQLTTRDLYNPFMQPLTVQRLILRAVSASGGAGAHAPRDYLRDNFNVYQVKVTDYSRKDITPSDWIPAGMFTDPRTGGWTFVRDLPPEGYFQFALQKATDSWDGTTMYPRISVIASRVEMI